MIIFITTINVDQAGIIIIIEHNGLCSFYMYRGRPTNVLCTMLIIIIIVPSLSS